MLNEKDTVKMWRSSWFDLLYTMKRNLTMLNDTQYYTTYGKRREEEDIVFLKRAVKRSNTDNILNEMAKQLGMTKAIDDALEHHSRIARKAKDKEKGMTVSQAQDILK